MRNLIPLIVLLVVIVGANGIYKSNVRNKDLPIIGEIGSFHLLDKENQEVRSEHLKGKIWVAHFFFTSCPEVCPLIMGAASKVSNYFKSNQEINIVSISVDSIKDTPKVLKEYSEKNSFNNSNWLLLTGSSSEIKNLSYNQFKLGLGDDFSLHSTKLVLIDRNGMIRGYYDSKQSEIVNKLINDISLLLKNE